MSWNCKTCLAHNLGANMSCSVCKTSKYHIPPSLPNPNPPTSAHHAAKPRAWGDHSSSGTNNRAWGAQ